VSTPVERAIEAAVAAGLSRVEAERIAAPTIPPVEPREAAGELIPLRPGDDRVRGWFDLVGWELEQDALRSALAMLGADQAQVDQLAAESVSRRGLPANAPRYIVIPNWLGPDGFQHYRDRDPIWIKTYTRLLSDDAYLSLSGHRRAVLHGLWLEYAMSGCKLRLDVKLIGRRLGLVVKMADLEAIKTQGFIRFALAPCSTDASTEKRREEPPISPAGETPTTTTRDRTTRREPPPPTQTLTCPVCRITKKTQQLLDDHLELVHERPRGATP
jgi:hypothetical protein